MSCTEKKAKNWLKTSMYRSIHVNKWMLNLLTVYPSCNYYVKFVECLRKKRYLSSLEGTKHLKLWKCYNQLYITSLKLKYQYTFQNIFNYLNI